ncbi:hypothetical protein H2200_012281 [Cladophialophora chaetospira]|uniref:Peptidase A1 domain-containing protein n=1 Tax=Cladophialophora chaetospira TaxID=386627 RepID=A0AA38WXK6_9EURO|nr:hypothetical protein H2200_012281 [Cladophialophora chaetospira]
MSTTTCSNLAEPLFLPIDYYNVSADGLSAPAWGISMGIGSGHVQWFSLSPAMYDFSLISNVEHCVVGNSACLAIERGTYDPQLSTTETNPASVSDWNGTFIRGGDDSVYQFYNDRLILGENNTSLFGYPFTTDDGSTWWERGSVLGIGPNSTFLQAIVNNSLAPSLSWGLWSGIHSVERDQPGLLIVGGYDDARVAHDFSTFDNTAECPGCIQIQGISWVDDTGTTPLTNESTPNFQVTLEPSSDYIRLPLAVYKAFLLATNASYDDYQETYVYPADNIPVGELTFTIKDGYTTSIPADELFHYYRGHDEDGNLVNGNDTLKIAWVASYTNENADEANYIYTWGIPFLTMNYLIMDVEKNQFRLSEAIRQDWGNEGGVSLRSLCSGLVEPDSQPKKTNVGALVGEIIGGVASLSIIIVVIIFCYRRRRNTRRQQSAGEPSAVHPSQSYHPVTPAGQQQPYSPTATYPVTYSPQTHTSYSDHPSPPAMMQHEYPKADQAGYPIYHPPVELPSPEHNPAEWRGSEISHDTNATRGVSGTLSSATTYNQRSELT